METLSERIGLEGNVIIVNSVKDGIIVTIEASPTIAIVAMLPTIGAEVITGNFVLIVKTIKGPVIGTIGILFVNQRFERGIVKIGTIGFIGHV